MAALCDCCKKNAAPARPLVVAIGGPTATGKTALSVALAERFGGEIISADSMQVYRGLDVGTAKATPEERQGIPHHLVDCLEPDQPYSVAEFTARAGVLIQQITARGHLPLVVGGTGLYATSLLNGVRFAPEPSDPALRQALQQQAEQQGSEALYARLQAIDAAYAAKVHPHNLPRVIRALELYELTGRCMSDQQKASRPEIPPYRSLTLCLTCRDRAELYRRIDARVEEMVQRGVVQEAQTVWQNRARYPTAAQAIGYKEFFPYFKGEAPLNDCVNALKQATRRYAKRQLTWFRNQTDAVWLYVDEGDPRPQVEALIQRFLEEAK